MHFRFGSEKYHGRTSAAEQKSYQTDPARVLHVGEEIQEASPRREDITDAYCSVGFFPLAFVVPPKLVVGNACPPILCSRDAANS